MRVLIVIDNLSRYKRKEREIYNMIFQFDADKITIYDHFRNIYFP